MLGNELPDGLLLHICRPEAPVSGRKSRLRSLCDQERRLALWPNIVPVLPDMSGSRGKRRVWTHQPDPSPRPSPVARGLRSARGECHIATRCPPRDAPHSTSSARSGAWTRAYARLDLRAGQETL